MGNFRRFYGWTSSYLRVGTKEGNREDMTRTTWDNDILSMWGQPYDYINKTTIPLRENLYTLKTYEDLSSWHEDIMLLHCLWTRKTKALY